MIANRLKYHFYLIKKKLVVTVIKTVEGLAPLILFFFSNRKQVVVVCLIDVYGEKMKLREPLSSFLIQKKNKHTRYK